MPTKSLQTRKVISNVLFGLGAVAAAVAIAAAVASLAFAVTFLPLAAIVGIGIASVALLTTGIILRLKKDTLSEENLPEVIKLLSKSDKNYIKDNIDFVKKLSNFSKIKNQRISKRTDYCQISSNFWLKAIKITSNPMWIL